MAREILFKAKRIIDGEWVEGDLIHSLYKIGDVCVGNFGNGNGIYQVDENTICQYTGLTDKNGNKIWENDVVEFEDVGEEGYEHKEGFDFTNRAKVEFSEARWSLNDFAEENSGVAEEMYNHADFIGFWKYCEVIGNIFDNHELINTTEIIGYADNGGLMSAT